jgi:hypothetical protein
MGVGESGADAAIKVTAANEVFLSIVLPLVTQI